MFDYLSIHIQNGSVVINEKTEKFQEIYKTVESEIKVFQQLISNTSFKVDIQDSNIRLGIDDLSAEDILLLNQLSHALKSII